MKRSDLSPEALLPSREEDAAVFEDALQLVMTFMTENLECLSHLKAKESQPSSKSIVKSEIVALEILDIDEALTDYNIQILEQFVADTGKQRPQPQVHHVILILMYSCNGLYT